MSEENCDIGVENEFRGMDQAHGFCEGEEHGMASQGDRNESKLIMPVEEGSKTGNRVFSESVRCTCQFAWDAFNWDNRIRGEDTWGKN